MGLLCMASFRGCPQHHARQLHPWGHRAFSRLSHESFSHKRLQGARTPQEWQRYERHHTCRAAETSADTASAPPEDRASYRLVQITLKKPMGLVLADNKTRTNVIVEEIVPGGNAEKSGKIKVGDIISRCSATVLKDGREVKYEKEGYGQRLYTNWEKIMFDCEGEDFDTVMKALSSNTERWGIFDVTLELKRYLSQAARESSGAAN